MEKTSRAAAKRVRAPVEPVLEVGGGGWVRWVDEGLGIDVKVRLDFDPIDGRAWPVQVVATAIDEADDLASTKLGEGLRRLPWGRLEATANTQRVLTMLRARMDDDNDVEIPHGWRVVRDGSQPDPGGVDDAASDPRGTVWERIHPSGVDSKLDVPPGPRYPDYFYMKFAGVYAALAARGESPAAVLSEVNGVSRTTVHRWAREARRRGLLAPGRRGKTG